jgi:hypothetical protein
MFIPRGTTYIAVSVPGTIGVPGFFLLGFRGNSVLAFVIKPVWPITGGCGIDAGSLVMTLRIDSGPFPWIETIRCFSA